MRLQQRLSIPSGEMEALSATGTVVARGCVAATLLDPQHYLGANDEMPYVNARGEIRRIDRLVEFGDKVWVLDYKLGESSNPAPYRAQLAEYRTAMQIGVCGREGALRAAVCGGELSEL